MSKPVAVLAGGRGTRLGYPGQKCLVEVEGRPFLHWKLDQLATNGATHIHLLVAYRALEVIDAAEEWGQLPLHFHADRGTGKWEAHDQAPLPFVHWVTYGDCLLDVPLNHSKLPYVYVNDEFPHDAGVIYTWGNSRRWLPRYTDERSHHINTPEDLEVTRAHLHRHRVPR